MTPQHPGADPAGSPATAPLASLRYWTVAEAAALMRVSKMSVYRLVHKRELGSIRVGRSFRIPEDAITSYLGQPSAQDANRTAQDQDQIPQPPRHARRNVDYSATAQARPAPASGSTQRQRGTRHPAYRRTPADIRC
jgi:excisionase family DNA binding protein